MLSRVTPLIAQETPPLVQCFGHILTSDIVSPLDVPGFGNSAMDGYAVRLADVASGQPLSAAGKSFVGQPYHGEWSAGTCICIMTGTSVPEGCEAVVTQEQVERADNGVRLTVEAHSRQNIHRRGEDTSAGAVISLAGTRLTAAELPMIASLGIVEVPMIHKVHVTLLSTGDELQLPGQPLDGGQAYDTNHLAIHPMLEQLGYETINLGITRDDPHVLRVASIGVSSQADVMVSSSGASVGEADYTKAILEELGGIAFWKLTVKPGKPFAFGKLSSSWFCDLPDSPVSATLTFRQLARPLLTELNSNTANGLLVYQRIRTVPHLKKTPEHLDFQRGVLQRNTDGESEVTTTGHQGSHIFNSFSPSNYFIVLEHEHSNVDMGEWVEIEPFNALFGGL